MNGHLDGNNMMDVRSFVELLIDNLAGIVQYNGRFEEDIFSVCAIMTDEELGKPIDRLAVVNTLMMNDEDECLDHTYESFLSKVSTILKLIRCMMYESKAVTK